ncbi:hypothetical protein HHI36_002070 [Cryptolaemus montrouzieri]|uniref:Uncharacterized protein n=1 Tax=Cryptolaemus montrouzieri TaxID=559131 RepID=A0ABD2P9C3_9CUCU
MECLKCKSKNDPDVRDRDLQTHFPCDDCKKGFRKKCQRLSSTEVRCLAHANRIPKFKCDMCLSMPKGKDMNVLMESNKKLTEELNALKEKRKVTSSIIHQQVEEVLKGLQKEMSNKFQDLMNDCIKGLKTTFERKLMEIEGTSGEAVHRYKK